MSARYWQILPLSITVCPLLGLLVVSIITLFQPKVYESSTVIQVRHHASIGTSPGGHGAHGHSTFFPTQFEVVKARKTLDIVIDDLDLMTRWKLDRDATRNRLENSIKGENIKGTDLIEVRVQASTPDEARIITERVSEAYRSRRTILEHQRTEQALAELRNSVKKQEDVVEDKRKTLSTIIRNQHLLYNGKARGAFRGSSFSVDDQAKMAANSYAELSEQKVLLDSQIETLLKYDGDQLMTYAAELQLPENIIRTLYPQYLETKRSLDALKLGGLGESHPNVIQQKEIIEGMRQDLDEGIVALRKTLRAQLELATEQLARLNSQIITSSTGFHGYDDAKIEFETHQRLLEQLKIKLVGEEMQRRITENSTIIHAEPFTPESPVYPNLFQHIVIGLLAGLVAGIILPFLIIPILNRRSPN